MKVGGSHDWGSTVSHREFRGQSSQLSSGLALRKAHKLGPKAQMAVDYGL